jgi:hemolysin activation/secretion protein
MRKLITAFLLLFVFVISSPAKAQISEQEQKNIINIQDQILQRQGQIESNEVQQKELKTLARDKEKIIKQEEEEDIEDFSQEDGKIIQNYRRIQCFRVNEITFSENEIISKGEEDRLVANYLGRCLNLEQISDLSKEITNHLVTEGYITSRAEIPSQSLYTKQLKINIIQSYLEDIVFNENDFFDRAQRFSVFGFFETGGILNIKPIEAALDQVNRLQSSNATIKILPGNKKDHSIVLIETRSTKPAHISFLMDNNGNERTGARRETLAFSYDNLLQLNDVFTLQRTANDLDEKRSKNGGTNSISTSFSVPILSYNFSASYSNSKYFFRSGDTVRFKSDGETSTTILSMDKVFTKTKKTKIAGGVSFTNRYNRNFIEGVKIDASSRKASFITTHYAQSFFLKNATFFVKPSYSKVIGVLNSKKDRAGLTSNAPHSEFDIFSFYGNYFRNLEYFGKKFSYNLIIDAQQSSQRLYGIDQFAVGGIFSVRGYKNGSISGDSGYNFRNEVSINLNQIMSSEKVNLQRFSLSPFYDYGYVRAKGGKTSGRLSGAGVKLSFYHQDLEASLTLSKPISKSRLLQDKDFYDDEAIFFNIRSGFSI